MNAAPPVEIVIDVSAGRPQSTFRPQEALGAGVDGSGAGETERLYTPHNVAAMRAAGLRPLTYRLRTELGIEAWHWGEEGTWSDPANAQGYWTTSDRPSRPIMTSFGYQLPRRGDTIDQANNTGYSRLDDGDEASFWKTNPYLDPRYSHETARPQWAVFELDRPADIAAARISWGAPFAVDYEVQHWTGSDEYDPDGRWVAFPHGMVTGASGGTADLALAATPIRTRFVRLWLQRGSNTAPPGANDPRDAIGFAVREVQLGLRGPDGGVQDVLRHGTTRETQTIVHVSSTDPWHRALDRDPELEQPGLDRVYRSGLTSGLPMLAPVGVLYDTPDNAAALVRFLKWRGYPIRRIELGEEPDGQYLDAADYGALYLETADAIRAIDPSLELGGPSLQNGISDTWLDADPDHSWTSHLMRYLRARGRIGDLQFFSFERYPFDDLCGDIHPKLLRQSRMMSDLFVRLRSDGVPDTIPWLITEYGFSAYAGRPMVEVESALLNADMVGHFLTLGGDGTYLFGYGPNTPVNQHLGCAGYGNMMLHLADENGQAKTRMPAFHGARLMTQAWAQPGDGVHDLYPVQVGPGAGEEVTAYAVHRPDGRWAVMAINRDPQHSHAVRVSFSDGATLNGPVELFRYGRADYAWAPADDHGKPTRNLPPHRLVRRNGGAPVMLGPSSMAVIRGARLATK
jgi:hypothetical protein